MPGGQGVPSGTFERVHAHAKKSDNAKLLRVAASIIPGVVTADAFGNTSMVVGGAISAAAAFAMDPALERDVTPGLAVVFAPFPLMVFGAGYGVMRFGGNARMVSLVVATAVAALGVAAGQPAIRQRMYFKRIDFGSARMTKNIPTWVPEDFEDSPHRG